MITRNTDYSIQHLRGLSTDTKPTDVPNGSEFREMDTGKKFLYSAAGTEWIEQPCCGGGGGSVEPLIVNVVRIEPSGLMMGGWRLDIAANDLYQAYVSGRQILIKQLATKQGDSTIITKYSLITNATASANLATSYKFYINTDDFAPNIASNAIKMFVADAPTDRPFCKEEGK